MKKLLSYIVLLCFFSVNNISFVFADNDVLNKTQISTINALDKIEDKVINTLDKVETKIKDEEQKEKLQEKQEEIQELIEQTKHDIAWEKDNKEIKEILQETLDTITLKAVAWITPTTDVSENITSQIDISKKDIQKAEDTLMDSIETKDWYTLMLKTKLSQDDVINTLKKYDENIKIDLLFNEEGYNYFELTISEDSLLRQELLEDVESLEVPNSLLWIEILKPELLKIWETEDNNFYSWEEIDKLWWIKKFNIQKYQDTIKWKTTKKIKVWIIDTWISYNHPDLKWVISKEIAWYDFVNEDNDPLDDQWHGTHVGWTIAWEINGSWVFWVNPNVELVALKICDSSGFCPTYGVLKALEYAKDSKLDVLNMSLWAKWNVSTSPICQAIKDITWIWTIVVAASGNSNIDTSKFVPGWCSEAITVWAVDENLKRATFSNYWEKVDVSAPGVWIYSTYLNNSYKSLNWTSMATPHIVWLVSILKTFKPNLTTNETKDIFKNNSIQVTTESNKKIASFVDVEKMMKTLWVEFKNELVENKLEDKVIVKSEVTNTWNIQKVEESWNTETKEKIEDPKDNQIKEKTPEEEWIVDISTIDESIWLTIQNPEEETTRINSAESEWKEFLSEWENNNEEIEKQTINLNWNQESNTWETQENGSVEINNAEDEIIEELNEDVEGDEDSNPEEQDTAIQNSYTCSLNIWWSCSVSLLNAKNYTYYASQGWYLSHSVTTSKVTIYWNKAGTTNFYIKSWSKTMHTVVVTVSDPIRILKASIGSASIQNWSSTNLNITDWNGGYSVSSSNTNVIQVSWSNTSWTLYAKSIWSSTIYIKDSKNKTASVTVSVIARNLTLSTYSLTIDKWTYWYFSITDWNGGYLFKRNNNYTPIYIDWKEPKYKVYGQVIGNYIIQVSDSAWKKADLSVKVVNPLQVTGFGQSITKYVWETIWFNIIDGNWWYSISSSNSNIASVYLNWTAWSIFAKWAGNATITIRDSIGKTTSLNVEVKEYVSISKVEYTESIEDGYIGWIYFETTGDLWEVWIEYSYTYNNSSPKAQIIPVNNDKSDKTYASFIVPNCTSSCYIYARPYIKAKWSGTKIYRNLWTWYTISYWINLLTSVWWGTKIANAWEEELLEESEDENNEEVDNTEQIEENSSESEEELTWTWIIEENGNNEWVTDEDNEEWVEVNSIWAFFVALEIISLIAIFNSFDDVQPVFPVLKLKPLFAWVSSLKNVLKINSKANLDWLASKSWVWASKIYNVLIRKFRNVNWVDDIIKIANEVKITKQVGNWWNAIMINWWKEVGDSIKAKLIKDWWKKSFDWSVKWKWYLTTLEKWKEKINIRDFDTSATNWSYPGYTHKNTIEVLKYSSENARIYKQKELYSKEIKFILPIN